MGIRRTSGYILDKFTFLGRDYIAFYEDPQSNYVPKVDSRKIGDLRNPEERFLVNLYYALIR